MSEDLTARVAELASRIEAHLVDDYKAADLARRFVDDWTDLALGLKAEDADVDAAFPHIDRNSPARASRRVNATRKLVAAILAEQHRYDTLDASYSCPLAADPGTPGQLCDCGRDERVARLLGIIVTEWEDSA